MTLLELLHLLRKKWYLVVVFPLVFAGATAIYCWGFMSNDYTSDVSLYVLNKTDEQSSNITSSDTTASQQLANDIAVMAQSNRVIDATAQSLGMSTLKGYDIKVTSATTNRVITLSVTGKKPEAVAQIANELAKQTADTAVEVMELKAVNIVDAAQVPNAPSGPNRIMYTAVAFLAGLFFAVALIVLLDLIDTTVKSPEEAEELLGLPVLGRMPALKGKGKKSKKILARFEHPQLSNASKTLLANIRFASVDEKVKTIVVTSSEQNEGKTIVALLADTGERYLSTALFQD